MGLPNPGLQSLVAATAKSLGERGEDFAARYLKRLGYHIVGRHVDLPLGELDIDRRRRPHRRLRRSENPQLADARPPAEAIDDRKEQRMTQAALAYLKSHGLLNHAARFDVVAVTWPADASSRPIEHIQRRLPRRRPRPVF